MSEATSRVRVDINTQEIRQAAEATGDVASNYEKYVTQAGLGRKEAEATLDILRKQRATHAEIGQAMEQATRRLKEVHDLQAKFRERPDDVFGPLVNAGAAPVGGYPGLEKQLDRAERQAQATLDRLQRRMQHDEHGDGGHGGGGHGAHGAHASHWPHRLREALEIAGVATGVARAHESMQVGDRLYQTLFRAGMASGGDPTSQERLYQSWNDSSGNEHRKSFLRHFAALGVGPQELANMQLRLSAMTGTMPSTPEFAGRLAAVGQVTGDPEAGLEYYKRMYGAAEMSEQMASGMLAAMLRYSASGIPKRELIEQNANLIERLEHAQMGVTAREGTYEGVLQMQQSLTQLPHHVRARGEEVSRRLFTLGDGPMANFIRNEAYAATSREGGGGGGRSSLGSFEDQLRSYQLFEGEGWLTSGEARVNIARALKRMTEAYGGGPEGRAAVQLMAGKAFKTMTPELFEELIRDPERWRGELSDTDRALVEGARSAAHGGGHGDDHGHPAPDAGANLAAEIEKITEQSRKSLGAYIAAANATDELGLASIETAVQLRAWAKKLAGENPGTALAAGPAASAASWLWSNGGSAMLGGAGFAGGMHLMKGLLGKLTASSTASEVAAVATEAASAGISTAALMPALIGLGIPLAVIGAGIYESMQAGPTPGDPSSITNPPLPRGFDRPPAGTRTRASGNELARRAQYRALVDEAADAYGVDRYLAEGLVGAESKWNPNAVSPKGARGLTQMMPGTARDKHVTDINDPRQQAFAGVGYLRDMLDLAAKRGFTGQEQVTRALEYYNGGGWRTGSLPVETQEYPGRVLGKARLYEMSDRTLVDNPKPPQMEPVAGAISKEDLALAVGSAVANAQQTMEPREVQSDRSTAVTIDFHGDTAEALRALPSPIPSPPLSPHGYSRGRW